MRCYVCVPVWGWEQMVEDSSILTLLPSFYKFHRGQPRFSILDTTNSTKPSYDILQYCSDYGLTRTFLNMSSE